MESPKRKDSFPPRSTFSAPSLGSNAAPLLPPWVSLTQVPDNPPSQHYSVTASPTTSLLFDPCSTCIADRSSASPTHTERGCRDQLTAGTEHLRRLPASADAATAHNAAALLSALLIAACLVGVLVTVGRLFAWNKDAENEGVKSTAKFMAQHETATVNARETDAETAIDGELDSIGGDIEASERGWERMADEDSRPSTPRNSSRSLSARLGGSKEHLVERVTAREPRVRADPGDSVRGPVINNMDENAASGISL